MLTLDNALRVSRSESIAFVGAGGKTTAMFQLAREMGTAVITTTTHLGKWQLETGGHERQHRVVIWPPEAPFPGIERTIGSDLIVVVGPLESDTDRYQGLTSEQLGKLHEFACDRNLPLLIEADGARGKAIKAPGDHEPVIPAFVDSVAVVAGLAALANPLDWSQVHRPEIFAELAGLRAGQGLTGEALARVMTHPDGGLKGIPERARRTALLNQTDTAELQSAGARISSELLQAYDGVVVAALASQSIWAVRERIAGIVLAAGGSRRFGQPKPLLDYRGKPFIRVVTETALAAGLDPVIVVTGSGAEPVEAAVQDLPVWLARNDAWESGQASSIRAGLTALETRAGPRRAGGAVFLLADMPQVTAEVVRAIIEARAKVLPAVLAPLVEDRRANPTLFDRETFGDLMQLEGDVGGRAIFAKFPPSYLTWLDEGLLRDIDTPEDYTKLIRYE